MDRLLTHTPATITASFEVDGTPVEDPGDVTVTVTRDSDGETLVDGATADVDEHGVAAYQLGPAALDRLDLLEVRWDAEAAGRVTRTVEVAGGWHFPMVMLAPRLADTSGDFPAAARLAARSLAESILEDACRVAFVPRYRRQVLEGSGTRELLLDRPLVRTVRAVTVDGEPVDPSTLRVNAPGGVLTHPELWPAGATIEVVYAHGRRSPPPRVSLASCLVAKHYLVESPIDDRAISRMSTDTGMWEAFLTPGVRGALTAVPEAEAVISSYSFRTRFA